MCIAQVKSNIDVLNFILQNEKKYHFGAMKEEDIYKAMQEIIIAKGLSREKREKVMMDTMLLAWTSTYAKLASLLENEHTQEYMLLLYQTSTHYLVQPCMSGKWLVDNMQKVHGGVSILFNYIRYVTTLMNNEI